MAEIDDDNAGDMMKNIKLILSGVIISGMVLSGGCEWSSGGDGNSYNTSQGAGVDANISGYYNGTISGTSIGSLVVSQTGNLLEVQDSRGSSYVGSVGAPGNVVDTSSGVRAGTSLVQWQVSWSGWDDAAGQQVNFAGIVSAVTVDDSTTSTLTLTNSETDGDTVTETWTSTAGSNPVVVTTKTISVTTGETLSESTTSTFTLSEATTQGRLQGNWSYEGGSTHAVDMTSPGVYGGMTSSTEDSTTF